MLIVISSSYILLLIKLVLDLVD